jgi:hypothetical protein
MDAFSDAGSHGRDDDLAAEAAELAGDEADRAEIAVVSSCMESLRRSSD